MNITTPQPDPKPKKPEIGPQFLKPIMSSEILTNSDKTLLNAAGITTTDGRNPVIILSARCQSFASAEICSVRPTWTDGRFCVLFGERTPEKTNWWALMFSPPTKSTTNCERAPLQAHVGTKAQIKLIARIIASAQVPRFEHGALKPTTKHEWDSCPDLDVCRLINYPQLILDKDGEIAALTYQIEHLRKKDVEREENLRIARTQVFKPLSPTPQSGHQPQPSKYNPGIMGLVLATGLGFIAAILLLGSLSAMVKL